MLKITNDDNQLTNKVNKILNNDTKNNAKKENPFWFDDNLSSLRGALYALLDEGNLNYEKYLEHLSKKYVKNKHTFIIKDNCGDDWVFDLIKTCAKFYNLDITCYSISDILKMPYDTALSRLGDINLSEYEKCDDIYNNLGYIEKLKHVTDCKFVLTYTPDYGDDELDNVFFNDRRVAYMPLQIPSDAEYAERLNDFKDVYMSDTLQELLHNGELWGKHFPSNEDIENLIETFWEGL